MTTKEGIGAITSSVIDPRNANHSSGMEAARPWKNESKYVNMAEGYGCSANRGITQILYSRYKSRTSNRSQNAMSTVMIPPKLPLYPKMMLRIAESAESVFP